MSAALRRAALAVVIAGAAPCVLRAQSDVPVGGVRFLSGLDARSVSFGAGLGLKSATEFAVPIGALWTVTPRLAFDFGVRYASASRTADDSLHTKASVSGLTDTQVRAVYQVVPDVVVLTVSANLPTGKTKLTSDELVAAGVMASDLIPFPVASFGSGANVTTGVAMAVPVGGWAVGLGGSYRLTSGYTPLAAVDSSYKPGGELRLRVGADRVVGQGRISLGFTFSTFADDAFGGNQIYRPGKRYITQGSWSFPLGNLGLALYAWDLYRNGGTVIVGGSTTEKQNVLAAGAAASVQIGRNVLRPQIEYRIQSAGVSSMAAIGHLLSLSARYQLPLTPRFTLLPAVRFDTGNLIYNGATIGLTGWGLTVGLRATM